jgi:hypothetical protein
MKQESHVTSIKLTHEQIQTIKKDLGIDNDKHVPNTIVVSAVPQEVAHRLSIESVSKISAHAVR